MGVYVYPTCMGVYVYPTCMGVYVYPTCMGVYVYPTCMGVYVYPTCMGVYVYPTCMGVYVYPTCMGVYVYPTCMGVYVYPTCMGVYVYPTCMGVYVYPTCMGVYVYPTCMGVYVYPTDSFNSEITDYGNLTTDITYWIEKGYTPVIGGDFNSRPRDLNMVTVNSLKWRYNSNVDDFRDINGSYFVSLCEALNILPLNHCIYYDKSLDGDFTYHKSGKRSQIDYILTDDRGRRFVNIFDIVKTGWHASVHLPLDLQIKLNWKTDLHALQKRAKELDHCYFPHEIKRLNILKHQFHFERAQDMLTENAIYLNQICQNGESADSLLDSIYNVVTLILNSTKCPKERTTTTWQETAMNDCDRLFEILKII